MLYLDTEQLASKAEVESMIGLSGDKVDTIKLDVEEYLIGLTHLSNELVIVELYDSFPHWYLLQSRLSVNCVTSEEYSRPEKIAQFITSLNSGFRCFILFKINEM